MDIFDLPPQQIFDAWGNDKTAWLLTADSLLASANILLKKIGVPAKQKKTVAKFWNWVKIYYVARMLRGMAIECSLKALWLHSGGVLVRNGKYRGIPGAKNHDLFSIYNQLRLKCSIILSQEELLLLSRVSYAIVEGRYPISKSFSNSYPSSPVPNNKVKWNKIEFSKDEKTFRSIYRKILAQIK